MIRPDIEGLEKRIENIEFLAAEMAGKVKITPIAYLTDVKPLIAYIRELEAKNIELRDQAIDDMARLANANVEIGRLEIVNKTIQLDTAMKCAYLAWQACLHQTEHPERVICRNYGINLDSLYSTTWKELNK